MIPDVVGALPLPPRRVARRRLLPPPSASSASKKRRACSARRPTISTGPGGSFQAPIWIEMAA